MVGPAHKPRWFRCLMGRRAQAALQKSCTPDSFALLLAASGGPRWLGLVGIDRSINRFIQERSTPLPLLGASSGAWRMAALCADRTEDTYEALIAEYIGQRYVGKPTPREVSEVCREYLARVFTDNRISEILRNRLLQLNFITALFPTERPGAGRLIGDLLLAALLNLVDRKLLGLAIKRAVFSVLPHPPGSPLGTPWDAVPSVTVPLSGSNFLPAILATGSIPTVLEGESGIPGSVRGHHLDGGLVDYHFEIEAAGPILYPHFSDDLVPGWMDRFFPFRRISRAARAQLCIIMPSASLLARFSAGDFPCRADFSRYSNDRRIALWQKTAAQSRALEEELTLCLECGELARVAEPL